MELIRTQRLAQGWSQQELGNRVGCTKQHISDLEHGNVAPSIRLLKRLASALNVPEAALLADSIPETRRAAP